MANPARRRVYLQDYLQSLLFVLSDSVRTKLLVKAMGPGFVKVNMWWN